VNVASVPGHIAPRFPQAAYAASKAWLLGLTRDLAQEWSGRKASSYVTGTSLLVDGGWRPCRTLGTTRWSAATVAAGARVT
jgi:NAD(P)-dependent dehydrogenase (short-subunit alcohol dehydrogenase family)